MAVAPIFFQPFAPEVNTGLIYTFAPTNPSTTRPQPSSST